MPDLRVPRLGPKLSAAHDRTRDHHRAGALHGVAAPHGAPQHGAAARHRQQPGNRQWLGFRAAAQHGAAARQQGSASATGQWPSMGQVAWQQECRSAARQRLGNSQRLGNWTAARQGSSFTTAQRLGTGCVKLASGRMAVCSLSVLVAQGSGSTTGPAAKQQTAARHGARCMAAARQQGGSLEQGSRPAGEEEVETATGSGSTQGSSLTQGTGFATRQQRGNKAAAHHGASVWKQGNSTSTGSSPAKGARQRLRGGQPPSNKAVGWQQGNSPEAVQQPSTGQRLSVNSSHPPLVSYLILPASDGHACLK